MKLLETNWDAPQGATPVEVEYPDALVQEFVNWIRRAPAWRENLELVERRVMLLNRKLAEYRNDVASGRIIAEELRVVAKNVTIAPSMVDLSDPAARAVIERELKRMRAEEGAANRRAALEKARAAKRAKADAVPA